MLKPLTATLVLGLMFAQGAVAQQAKPTDRGGIDKPVAAPPRPDPRQPVNIRLDLTISDQTGSAAPVKRNVSMIVADGREGSIRSSGDVTLEGKGRFSVVLNVDAEPWIIDNNKIRLTLTLDYSPKPATENATSGEGRGVVRERLALIVEAGKPITISQASDPTADRKITADLVATILK
jgi:hypothetical protein